MIKRNIPNAITCGNLLCGCLAILKIFDGDLIWAAYLIGIAAILDFFDGFAARLLKVSSPIGKDLDSLADMVTFGVVPGFIMFKLIGKFFIIYNGLHFNLGDILNSEHSFSDLWSKFNTNTYLSYFSLLIPIFSAVRLAKFNNDVRQSDSFIGVPTPANAILIGSIAFIFENRFTFDNGISLDTIAELSQKSGLLSIVLNPYLLCALSVVLSFLLVAELPLFSLKFKHFKWKGNEIRYSYLLFSCLLLITLKSEAIPVIILFYILFSVGNNLINRSKNPLS